MATQSPRPVKVTSFPLHYNGCNVGYVVVGALILLSSRRAFVAPGSVIYETLLQSPEAGRTAARVQDWLFGVTVAAHAVEAPLFAATKLRKHGVPFLSVLWWKWFLACFVFGANAWSHFARTVADAQGKQA